MSAVIIFISAFLIVVILFAIFQLPLAHKHERNKRRIWHERASMSEEKENFREACYYNSLLINSKEFDKDGRCQKLAGKFWKEHGPFDFEDLIRRDMGDDTSVFNHGSEEEAFHDSQQFLNDQVNKISD